MHQERPSKSIQIVLCLVVLIVTNTPLFAQQDTLYYTSNWKTTVKDSASFFRPPVQKLGKLYKVKDFFINGQLQMEGFSKNAEKDIWEGRTTWYNEDGSIFQQGNYSDGKLNGDFVSILDDKQLVAEFKNNRYVSGERNLDCGDGRYLYTKTVGDTIVEIMHGADINGLRYETYRTADYSKTYYTRYYGKNGTYIGERKISKDGYASGTEVDYYRNPMRIREIRYYDAKGQIFSTDNYYENGQYREKFNKVELSKTYYTTDGKELGKMKYRVDRGRLKPFEGKHFYFFYGYNNRKNELIQSIRDYENGKIVYEEHRYENQTVKSKTEYDEGKKTLQISFNEMGEEIARITYDNYIPQNGTEIIGDTETTYEDGKVVSAIQYYPKTKIVLSKKTPESEKFYDKDGKELGVLKYDLSVDYPKPYEGKRFTASYEGEISLIEEYKAGSLYKQTSFRKRVLTEDKSETYKKITIYEEGSYNKVKEMAFYSTNQIQSEISFSGYDKTFGTFYDMQGKVLGTFDYRKKDGTLYEFFGESDYVKLFEMYGEGKLFKSKKYTYGPNNKFGNIDPVLIEDIDIDCCAKSYNIEGDTIAECTFKDQKPWEGTIYDTLDRTLYTIKNGERNGSYKKLDYNGNIILEKGQFENNMAQGEFNYYSYQEILQRTERFKDDKLHGETVYYNPDGTALTSIIYENGKPMNGTILLKSYSKNPANKEIYKEGKLIERLSFDENGKRVTKFKDGKETETIAYHKESNVKRLSYAVDNGYLTGAVVRFNENGVETNRAIFENGKFIKGDVILYGTNIKGRPDHIILERKPDFLKVTFMGQNDKVLFTAEENLAFGVATVFTQQLGVYMDYITPNNLY